MTAFTTGLPLLAFLAGLLVLPAQAQDADKNFYVGGSFGYSDLAVDDPATDYPPVFAIYAPDLPAIRSDNYDVDDRDTSWGIYGGYHFNRYMSIETGYTVIGEAEIDQESTYIFTESTISGGLATHTQANISVIETGLKVLELTAIARYPLTDRFSVYGKFGGVRSKNVLEKDTTLTWSILTTRTGFPDENRIIPVPPYSSIKRNTSIDMTIGLGTEYYITGNITIRGQWQQYRIRNEWDQYGIKMKNNINTYTLGMNYRFGF